MNVLVLNAGSSTLRFQMIETDTAMMKADADRLLARGTVERIGGRAIITLRPQGKPTRKLEAPLRDHRAAIEYVLAWVVAPDSGIEGINALSDVHAVGHRVVHGGQDFRKSVRIDEEVLSAIEDCIELAPLHNPANVHGIRAAREFLGTGVPQVAVFDTAFHSSMREAAYLYAIPYHYYRRLKVRRYGFHGTSHRYVAYRFRKLLDKPKSDVNIITLHLGNGCSACAIAGGVSVETSMGFTPLEGLVMGTRCGDLDPSLVEYIAYKDGLSLSEVDTVLNKQSGLLGVSGLTGDMRDLLAEVEENGDRRARLAIDVFCDRVRKYIGAYCVQLDEVDAVVFTGGIGENAWTIREQICRGLARVGLTLDLELNRETIGGRTGLISAPNSRLAAYVIPTNEELLIARDTARALQGPMGGPETPASIEAGTPAG